MRKILYISIGCISVVLGIIGVFVPGLPTTPFLLLSSWLFYKSSKNLHVFLHQSPLLGPYLDRFQRKQGVNWTTKLISMGCMWTMILISSFGYFENWHVRFLLMGLGIIGTMSILIFIPLRKKESKIEGGRGSN